MQAFWFVPTQSAWRVDYTHIAPQAVAVNGTLSAEAANTTQGGGSAPTSSDAVSAMDGKARAHCTAQQ